jgi:hypothetical protein
MRNLPSSGSVALSFATDGKYALPSSSVSSVLNFMYRHTGVWPGGSEPRASIDIPVMLQPA